MEKYIKASMEVVEFGKENILTQSVAEEPHFVKGDELTGTTRSVNWDDFTN